MTPIQYTHPTSATGAHLVSVGADCEIEACPRCGSVLLEGARCSCPPRSGRLHLSLAEAIEEAAVEAASLSRLTVRGEVIA